MSLFFYVLKLNYSHIYGATYNLVFMSMLSSLFCCLLDYINFVSQVFHGFWHILASLIDLYNAFSSLSSFFVLTYIHFCVLDSLYGFNYCNLILTRNVLLVLVLVSFKVASFYNEAPSFLKLSTNF